MIVIDSSLEAMNEQRIARIQCIEDSAVTTPIRNQQPSISYSTDYIIHMSVENELLKDMKDD